MTSMLLKREIQEEQPSIWNIKKIWSVTRDDQTLKQNKTNQTKLWMALQYHVIYDYTVSNDVQFFISSLTHLQGILIVYWNRFASFPQFFFLYNKRMRDMILNEHDEYRVCRLIKILNFIIWSTLEVCF